MTSNKIPDSATSINPSVAQAAPSDSFARRNPRSMMWLAIGIILLAANLRAALTSVGPVVSQIRDDMGLTNTMAGLLTTLGLVAFAVISPIAPKLSRRYGSENLLLASMVLITIGVGVRSMPYAAALFGGTVLIGLAIGIGNVLIPGLIKRDFPNCVGLLTGIYSVVMTLLAGIASGVSIPIAEGTSFGWRGALGVWGILSVIAFFVWLPQVVASRRRTRVARAVTPTVRLWKSPLAWQVTLYMGFQSIVFYVNVTWLPEILQDRGMSASTAGWMLSLVQIISLPATFLAPVLAGRRASQRALLSAIMGMLLVGYAGLIWSTGPLVVLWIILVGLGAGASFSLCLVFFSLRTRTAEESAELSGMAQSVGYLIAAAGPALVGYIHDASGNWSTPLATMVIIVLIALVFGLGAARNAYVSSEKA